MDMNEYTAHIARDPMWVKNNVVDIALDQVHIAPVEGQVRQGGTINSHLEELEVSIAKEGQRVPITVEKTESGFRAADGNHRLKALRSLYDNVSEDTKPKYALVRAHVREFSSAAERLQWQLKANDHLPSRSSTEQDVKHIVQKLMDCDCPGVPEQLQGGHGNKYYEADPESYQKVLKGYLETSTSLTSKQRSKVAKEVMKGFPNQKLENFSNQEVQKKFSGGNSLGWEKPSKPGAFNGWRIETLGQRSNVFPNITGNSFRAKTLDSNVKTAVVIWDSNPFGKTGSKLDEVRRNMIGDINIANKSSLLRDGTVLIDKVFITPQKIGAEIAEEGFYEVVADESGFFGKNDFPISGWSNKD